MSDAEDCCTLELFTDKFLNGLFSDYINVCCRFIENYNFVAPEDGSNDADQLSFSNTQVLAFVLDLELEAFTIIFLILLFLLLVFIVTFVSFL